VAIAIALLLLASKGSRTSALVALCSPLLNIASNHTGGVFEEAIAIASLLLEADCPVAATVRTAGGFIDNTFQVGGAEIQSHNTRTHCLSRESRLVVTRTRAVCH